jgi:hypothetical protein
MQVHVPLATTINHNNQFIVDKAYIPPVIEISAYATQVSHEKLIALCAHEIQHLIQHHTITDIIKEYIEHYSSINSNTLDACPEYQKLGQLHEAQAEVFSAIKNPEIAHCLKEYRRCTFYPDNLYEKHYYNISTIDMLWKLDDWLTKWQQFSIINTTYDMLAKMRTIAGAFKELITA